MHLIIRYASGKRVDAMMLAVRENNMRVAVAGSRDAVEFRRIYDQWTTESGDPIEVESMITDGRTDVQAFCTEALPQVSRAGR